MVRGHTHIHSLCGSSLTKIQEPNEHEVRTGVEAVHIDGVLTSRKRTFLRWRAAAHHAPFMSRILTKLKTITGICYAVSFL